MQVVRQQNEGSFASEASASGEGLQMCLKVGGVSFFFFIIRSDVSFFRIGGNGMCSISGGLRAIHLSNR